jgi:hypothetical protein
MVRPDVPAEKKEIRRHSGKRTTEEIKRALNGRITWWEEFWKVYPCHDAMNPTMDSYERAVADRDKAVLLWKGAKVYAAKAAADPTMKLAHGATWIHQERWTDPETLPAVVARPARRDFVADVEHAMAKNMAEKGKPW